MAQAAINVARGQKELRALMNSLKIIATSATSAIVSQIEKVT
jgi:hypothetical protein